jgi:hypothetical protein
MNKIAFFFLFIIAVSCRPVREIGRVSTDSVRIERLTEYRDTTIMTPADSSWLQALIECDSNGQAYIRQIQAYRSGGQSLVPVVRIQDNTLKVDCKCDSMAIYQKLYRIHDQNTRVSTETQTISIQTNRLTWFQKTQIYAFWIMALIFLARIIIKRFLI